MNTTRHAGRIMAITGGSSGIGQAIALRMVSEGATVAVIDTADATETIALAAARGGDVTGYECDVPGLSHYIASKAALIGFVRGLAVELGGDGITVNALAPGLTPTKNAVATVPQAHL